MTYRHIILLPLLVLLLSGCAVATTDTVATMPAITTGSSDQQPAQQNIALPTSVAVLPFANNTESEFAFSVVRRTLVNHFSTKNYRLLHWQDVDNRLRLAGIANEDITAQSPESLMQLLGVDGLIYGNITHYNKTFAGVYAQIAVGVELDFINQRGDSVWSVKDVRRSHSGGLSTTPVGLIMNALVAAKHIYGDLNLYRAADDLGRDLAEQMPSPAALSQREKPTITNVVHSGVNQHLRYGDTLQLGLEGAPGMTAAVMIEGLGAIDLTEQDPGQYVGSMAVGQDINLDGVIVTGRLQDSFGQTSSWISPYGLLVVDNTAPGKVTDLQVKGRDGSIHVDWQAPADDDIAGFQVMIANTETGDASLSSRADNSEYIVTDVDNFSMRYLRVAAVDHAGNTGEVTRIAAMAAPDSRYAQATDTSTVLPMVISGIQKLTPQGNPYFLRGKTRIGLDGVLLIAPGVELQVSPQASLAVLGELHVHGNSTAPVSVSSADGQTFNEFLLLQSKQAVSIAGLNVTGAGIAVQIFAGSPLITDSSFVDNAFNGLSIQGSAKPTIRNSLISGALASGVLVAGQAQPIFENNRFADNQPFHLQNGSSFNIDASTNQWQPAASSSNILGDVTY